MASRPLRVTIFILANFALIALGSWATARLTPKAPPPAPDDGDPFVAYYGRLYSEEVAEVAHHDEPHNSNAIEEAVVREFFADRDGGVFLDIGANHYKNGSNTYYLEKNLNWSGIAVDALDEFRANWEKNRPNTKFFTAFISDKPDAEETIYVAKEALGVSSATKSFTEDEEHQKGKTVERKVPTMTLDQLLSREKVEHVDFVSIDIELAEPKALAGFDIEKYRPALVCIEAHKSVRQQILDYFARHKYVLLGKYLHADFLNLYFKPLD